MVERTVHIHEATMSRLDDFIAILNGTKTTPLEEEHPLDGILLSILIHAAFSDGIVVEEEFDGLPSLPSTSSLPPFSFPILSSLSEATVSRTAGLIAVGTST